MYFVYILASRNRVLYIGVTGKFEERLNEHRYHKYPKSFASQYKCDQLIYFEEYGEIDQAIAREKQLKGWRRSRKIALIETLNPDWRDLAPWAGRE